MKKKAILISCITLLSVGCISLSSCEETKPDLGGDDGLPFSVTLSGLSDYYTPEEASSIDWSGVTLTLFYRQEKTTKVLTSGEFDTSERSSEEVEFTLETSGLYTYCVNQDSVPEDEYPLSYTIWDEEEVYTGSLKTIVVTEYPSTLYVLEAFSEPDFQQTYERNLTRVDDSDDASEDSFYDSCEYTVGDDSPFIYQPTLELIDRETYEHIWPEDYPVDVTVTHIVKEVVSEDEEIDFSGENDEGEEFDEDTESEDLEEYGITTYSEEEFPDPLDDETFLDDESEFDDETRSGDGEDDDEEEVEVEVKEEILDLDNNKFVSYSDFSFDFTEEAVGETFRLEMIPKYFSQDEFGYRVAPSTLEVVVQDGWNVYTPLDLGRMNLYSGENYYTDGDPDRWDPNDNHRPFYAWKSSYSVFPVFDEETGAISKYTKKFYSDEWYDFLESRGEENLGQINGVFFHTDLNITNDDIPSSYVISEEEATIMNCNYADMVGSIRDGVIIYDHCMDEDFTINGNLFSLNVSHLMWAMTRQSSADSSDPTGRGLTYYSENNTSYSECGVFLFNADNHISRYNYDDKSLTADFLARHDGANRRTFYMENLEVFGNQERNWNFEEADDDEDASKASGCMVFCRATGGFVKAKNVIAKHFLTSFYGWYTCDEEGVYGFDVTDAKIFDCYGSAFYVRFSAYNYVSHSVVKRFGGPVALIIGSESIGGGVATDYAHSGIYLSEDVTCEAYLYGGESWFDIYGIKLYITYLNYFDTVLRGGKFLDLYDIDGVGKTIYNPEMPSADYFNLIEASMDSSIQNEDRNIYTNFTYNGVNYLYDGNYGKEKILEDGTYYYQDIEGFEPDTHSFSYLANTFKNDEDVKHGYEDLSLTTFPVFMTNTGRIFSLTYDYTSIFGIVIPTDFYLFDLDAYYNRSESDSSKPSDYKMEPLGEEDDTVFMYMDIYGIELTICFSLYDVVDA